jgi:hypothetical protein
VAKSKWEMTMDNDNNPRISGVLLGVTWLEVLILLWAGLGLLLYPPIMEPFWPWPLAPFNLRYLGGLYTAALVAAFLQAWCGRWSPARVVTPMIFIFTLVVTVYSFVHLDRFDLRRLEAWIWFILYIGVCTNAGIHIWLYRKRPLPQPSSRPRGALRTALWGVTIVLGTYGLSLLLAPTVASWFWPWKLDTFHAHLYSVTFLTPALGAWVLLRGTTRNEQQTLGLTLAAWGLMPILALILADATVKRVHWDLANTWMWLVLFGAMAGIGGWLAVSNRQAEWREDLFVERGHVIHHR